MAAMQLVARIDTDAWFRLTIIGFKVLYTARNIYINVMDIWKNLIDQNMK